MKHYSNENGFSLVELMIGLVIGLIIVLGVVTVYLGSARSQTTNSAIIEVQTAARFAHHFLSEDLQPAGFTSVCPSGEENQLNLLANHARYTTTLYNSSIPVMAWSDLVSFNAAPQLSAYIKGLVAGSYLRGDILLVQHASIFNTATLVNDIAGGNSFAVAGANFPLGSVLVLSDMQRCIVFQNQSNVANTIALNGARIPGNNPDSFPAFTDDPVNRNEAKLFQFITHIYFIGQGNTLNRLSLTEGLDVTAADIEVLVDGVEDMRFQFGVVDNNRELNAIHTANQIHTTAALNWSDVGMVRGHLLARSQEQNILDAATAVTQAPFNQFCTIGDDALAGCQDRRLRYVFSHNYAVRNILP